MGGAHPHKADAQLILERLVAAKERLVSDAEVLQEILHRYTAIEQREAIRSAVHALLSVVDEIFPVESQDMLRAAAIVSGTRKQTARDALHIAVMERYGITAIFTFDADFGHWPGLERISRV